MDAIASLPFTPSPQFFEQAQAGRRRTLLPTLVGMMADITKRRKGVNLPGYYLKREHLRASRSTGVNMTVNR